MSNFGSEHMTVANPALAALQSETVPGMAHWANTGPAGQSCASCALFRKRRKEAGQAKDAPRDGRCVIAATSSRTLAFRST